MRVLICGDRNYSDKNTLYHWMDLLNSIYPITTVIEGEARGADTLGRTWAESRGLEVHPYPADWNTHGKAAGPIRNTQMLKEGQPELVVAFHKDIKSSKGTMHMISIANKEGIPVFLYAGTY